ncbi:MAG: L,D-transpeptidase family protein [Parvularculaceae bacterium]
MASLVSGLALLCVAAFAGEAPVRWDGENARALIAYAAGVERHGLASDAYDPAALKQALADGDAIRVELAASALFRTIARDISTGVTPAAARRLWRFAPTAPDDSAIDDAMTAALATRKVAEALDSFAPPYDDYRKISVALASEPDGHARLRLLRNMERWRWMPRDLGRDYILVNIPAYEAVIVRDGREVARRRVIVGARKTPTRQFSASIEAVTLNPTWFVPASIVAESVGALLDKKPQEAERLGYYRAETGGVRQKPGPQNALGQVKFEMPNPYSVFIHDTPNRTYFDRKRRALSHGCIRIDDAIGVAAAVLGGPWSKGDLEALVASGTTARIELPAPLPVYVVYFTLMSGADGALVAHDDVYGLDKELLAGPVRGEVTSEASSKCPGDAPA